MLNYLFEYLNQIDFPGAGLFQYISFRAGMAAVLSLLITITFGKKLIDMLRKYQLGESIRDLGLDGQMEKKGTPASPATALAIKVFPVPVARVSKIRSLFCATASSVFFIAIS